LFLRFVLGHCQLLLLSFPWAVLALALCFLQFLLLVHLGFEVFVAVFAVLLIVFPGPFFWILVFPRLGLRILFSLEVELGLFLRVLLCRLQGFSVSAVEMTIGFPVRFFSCEALPMWLFRS
jgi:hypothetical protein